MRPNERERITALGPIPFACVLLDAASLTRRAAKEGGARALVAAAPRAEGQARHRDGGGPGASHLPGTLRTRPGDEAARTGLEGEQHHMRHFHHTVPTV